MDSLVIVESPTKARTLQKFLGEGYRIEASMGHIRDLPKSELGVDVQKNFEPKYIIPKDKQKKAGELKKLAKDAKVLWLATDPDREGEAIAWHLGQVISDKGKVNRDIKRVVFHEITPEAIQEAFKHPHDLDLKLVDAQQARRVLDRLVGYKLSPLLWQKIKKGLSAGRVQSVALRLIVEREREIMAFKAQEYWTIEVEFESKFTATVIEKDGKKLEITNGEDAKAHVEVLERAEYQISKITQKKVRRYPYPPFTTSTLQQASSNKLGFSAKKTMMLAQALYEYGLITYMRTDSFNLSQTAVSLARDYIASKMGKKYLPQAPRIYKSKSKNTQEAHEAIRPTDARLQVTDNRLQRDFTRDHRRLYELIWKRFVACQMSEAVINQTSVDITADKYLLRATGSIIKFEGWLKIYGKDIEDKEDEQNQVLPPLKEYAILQKQNVIPSQHFTQAPPRYTEASLIKKLEELGIGRPSTYAPTLSTIQERFYVEKLEKKFTPSVLGMTVADFLVKYFPDIFDYAFTAQLEDELDDIATGAREWRPTIKAFYDPFEKKIEETAANAEKVKMELEVVDKKCCDCGKDLVVRIGKFGKFLACSGFPECKHTESLEEKVNAICPDDQGEIVIRKTRKGKTFFGCKNWPACKFASWTKPK